MIHLIDKDAVVAEIERRKDEEIDYDESSGNFASYADQIHYSALDSVENFINTLEVKEVDLEKSARHYLLHEHLSPLNNILHQADLKTEMQYHKDIESAFKAGYEFCLKVQKGE